MSSLDPAKFWQLLFCFPKDGALALAPPSLPSVPGPQIEAGFLSVLTSCPPQFALTAAVRSTHGGLAAEEWSAVGEAPGALRAPVGQLASEAFAAAHGQASWRRPDAVRICIPLKPSESYLHSPSFFPSSRPGAQDTVTVGGVREEWTPSPTSCTTGKAGHSVPCSPFPCRRNHHWENLLFTWAGLPWGRSDVGKVKWFLLPSPLCPDLYFFALFFFLKNIYLAVLSLSSSMQDLCCSMRDLRCSVRDLRCSVWDLCCSVRDLRCSVRDLRCSLPDLSLWHTDSSCAMWAP